MLIALAILAIFGLGGGAALLDEIRDRVEVQVADPDRLESVGQMLDEVESASQAHQEQIQALADQVFTLNASYDSPEEDYASITARGLDIAHDLRAKLLGLRFSMKEQMTREEWTAVFPAPDFE